jgi:hypothetical protein
MRERKTILDEQKLRIYMSTRPVLQELLKDVLQIKREINE